MYGPFTNEELVGQALAGRRERVILATKFGQRARRGRHVPRRQRPAGLRAGGLRSLAAAARRRPHRPLLPASRRPTVPIEETVGAMAELVAAGKVRFLGLSEAGPETIRRAHASTRSPRCRPSTRSGRVIPRTARPTCCASSGSASSPTARSVAASSQGASAVATTSTRRLAALTLPAPGGRQPGRKPGTRRSCHGDRQGEGGDSRPGRDRLGAGAG